MDRVRGFKESEGEEVREEYVKELEELKAKMRKAEKFAKKIPVFEKLILERKLTGEEDFVNFGYRYKRTPYNWGIRRGFFKDGTQRTITNMSKTNKYCEHLFFLYFNTLSLYDSHESYGLEELGKSESVFFFDYLNSTFYIKDQHIEEFLEMANDWYLKALELHKEEGKKKEIEELKTRLERLQNITT